MRGQLLRFGLAVAALSGASVAQAATYVGSRTIGTGSVNISITTDGTIGVIGDANILDYTIQLLNLDGSFVLTSANSATFISGPALTATATDLLFDFDVTGAMALFQAPAIGSGDTFYCLQSSGATCYEPVGVAGEAVEATTDFVYPTSNRSGLQVIASVNGAIPEPGTWAMMLIGFGATGFAIRRRREHQQRLPQIA